MGSHPQPVINAAGVLLHTNLGRAPLAKEALRAVELAASGYSDLEYDLDRGERGSRLARLEELLCVLTGAEAALAVNNNAAAVLLALNTFAEGQKVIVSRAHLVEIGGSFRMPAIMAKSGCRMVEVGTTNKTHLKDYEGAIGKKTGLILQVHQSNFAQKGFVKQVPLEDLVELGHEHGIPVMDDQGSGIVEDPARLGAPDEPSIAQSLAAGVAVVTASGDKLLGGPQAGIVLGEKLWVDRMRANPLARAVRLDKLQISALEATLRLYLRGGEDEAVPLRVMATARLTDLKTRAEKLRISIESALKKEAGRGKKPEVSTSVVRSSSLLGGGSSPDVTASGWAVTLAPVTGNLKVSDLERALRSGKPPVIARVSEDQVMLEIRSIFPAQDARIPRLVAAAVKKATSRRR
jgi:L-seryl-tRNA(Ser) seleniumtransferase